MNKKSKRVVFEKRIYVRVSSALYKRLKDISVVSGISIADIVRKKIVGTKIPDKSRAIVAGELRDLKMEIRRQGGLLKHCINVMSENQQMPQEITDIIKRTTKEYEMLALKASDLFKRI